MTNMPKKSDIQTFCVTYHVSSASTVSGQSHLVVLALHVVASDPDGVLGVWPGKQALGELCCSINCQRRGCVLETIICWRNMILLDSNDIWVFIVYLVKDSTDSLEECKSSEGSCLGEVIKKSWVGWRIGQCHWEKRQETQPKISG